MSETIMPIFIPSSPKTPRQPERCPSCGKDLPLDYYRESGPFGLIGWLLIVLFLVAAVQVAGFMFGWLGHDFVHCESEARWSHAIPTYNLGCLWGTWLGEKPDGSQGRYLP